MKIKDVIALIDVNQETGSLYDSPVCEDGNIPKWANLTGYDSYQFDSWSDDFSKRMHRHTIYSWLCTDTVIGVFVYCLDKRPVAISSQNARKSYQQIEFIDKESYLFVRTVVGTFLDDSQDDSVSYANLDEEISSGWSERAQGKFSFNIEKQK